MVAELVAAHAAVRRLDETRLIDRRQVAQRLLVDRLVLCTRLCVREVADAGTHTAPYRRRQVHNTVAAPVMSCVRGRAAEARSPPTEGRPRDRGCDCDGDQRSEERRVGKAWRST